MATKWANSVVLDGGSDTIRTRTSGSVQMHVIKAYTAGDSYATVTGNSCGNSSMASGDFVQTGAAGSARTTTVASKTITLTANSGASPDLAIAVVDVTNSLVLLVTDETSNQVLTSGGSFTVPSWTYVVGQPT